MAVTSKSMTVTIKAVDRVSPLLEGIRAGMDDVRAAMREFERETRKVAQLFFDGQRREVEFLNSHPPYRHLRRRLRLRAAKPWQKEPI